MVNKRWGIGLGFLILLSLILLMSFFEKKQNEPFYKYSDESSIEENKNKEEQWNNPLNELKMVDNKEIYKEDKDSNVDELYMTILPPSSKESVTFEELNTNYNKSNDEYVSDAFDPVSEIIFEYDKSNSDLMNYSKPNATIEVRGQSSRISPQKSYKIKLFDNAENWHGFKTININKHFEDSLRIKNKLSFDYFEMLPDFVSLRTRFVKLYIKDLSSRMPDKKFKYYGLYTFIEQPNKRFLKRHGLDKNGNLYKAEFFEFFRYPDNLKNEEDITFDRNKFEEILEVSGNNQHEKLIEMLEAVNDYNRDIDDIVDKYFDRNNLLTWLGVNILFDNYDTNSRNFLIYSAVNSDKWFFIPWDYDKAWTGTDSRGKWERGLSNYWGMALFERFFKDINNVEDLSKKIEELSIIINEENTLRFLNSYYDVVKENVFVSPDIDFLRTNPQEYEKEYYSLIEFTEKNKQYYFESLENPMPFYLDNPTFKNGNHNFFWDHSFDFQGDDLTYKFTISTDYEFKNIIAEYNDLSKTSCTVSNLEEGEYYWKVIALDSKGNWQPSFDYYCSDGDTIYGVKKYIVK